MLPNARTHCQITSVTIVTAASIILIEVEPVGVLLMSPWNNAKWILLTTLVGHGEDLLALAVLHEILKLLDIGLSFVNALHERRKHGLGCGLISKCFVRRTLREARHLRLGCCWNKGSRTLVMTSLKLRFWGNGVSDSLGQGSVSWQGDV